MNQAYLDWFLLMLLKLQRWRAWEHNQVEPLRWILLVAGIIFVVVIYILGRSRRKRNHSMTDEFEDDLPAFTAQSLDDLDEGVGEVRIITRAELDTDREEVSSFAAEEDSMQAQEGNRIQPQIDPIDSDSPASDAIDTDATTDTTKSDEQAAKSLPTDIIVLYILPKPDQLLAGAQVNSSAQAMGLSFGEMNIFHYINKGRNVFSLANMLEPGSFDADTIHDLKTTGLTVFMRIQGDDPLDDLTEMLQRSYQLAGLLDARLCNHKHEPLTEQDAENYRTQVAEFIASKTPELSSES